jgi:hypothetical protein
MEMESLTRREGTNVAYLPSRLINQPHSTSSQRRKVQCFSVCSTSVRTSALSCHTADLVAALTRLKILKRKKSIWIKAAVVEVEAECWSRLRRVLIRLLLHGFSPPFYWPLATSNGRPQAPLFQRPQRAIRTTTTFEIAADLRSLLGL